MWYVSVERITRESQHTRGMLVTTQPVTTTDCSSPTSEMDIRSDDCLGPSSESSSSRDDNSPQDHALHAIGRRLGNGFSSHVRRWKRENTRKKLESHLIMRQQARRTVETTRHETMSKSPSFQSLGDIGMTLFSPLNVPLKSLALEERRTDCKDEFVMALVQNDDSTAVQLDTDDTSVTVEDESDEDDFYHHDFIYNDGTEIEAPLLLNMDDMRQLRQAMPSSTQLKLWKRLYSLARDGDVFQTFLSSVAGHRQTLLVIHTSTGETFGGFAEAHWGKLALKTDGSYHGTGRSFLFSIDSSFADLQSQSPSTVVLADEDPSHVTIHPWQGVNEYSILCSTRDGGRLCMGGGGKDRKFWILY